MRPAKSSFEPAALRSRKLSCQHTLQSRIRRQQHPATGQDTARARVAFCEAGPSQHAVIPDFMARLVHAKMHHWLASESPEKLPGYLQTQVNRALC